MHGLLAVTYVLTCVKYSGHYKNVTPSLVGSS